MVNKKNKIIIFFLLLSFLFGVYCAFNIGKGWDTFFFIDFGKSRLAYLLSFGSIALNENNTSQYYPGIYNVLNAFFLQIFPKNLELEFFHFLNFITSFFAVLGLYKLVSEIFNKDIAIITIFIFLLNPIFFGHMATNDRDTVVLLSNIWFTYYAFKYLKFNKEKNKKYVYYMSFFLALGLGTRFAFIATLIPLVFYIIYVIYKRRLNKEIKNGLLDALKIFLIASFIVILFWAPVHAVLFKGSLDLFLNLFKHPWGYPYVLLNGEIYEARNVPFYYIFVNLFYKSPEYIIILYLIFILNFKNIFIFLLKLDKNIFSKQIFIIACLILPTILHIFNPFSVYDGLRLFLFLLPYFSIIPALVIFYLIKNYKIKICKIFLTINCALFAYFLYFFISLTPYHYSYINLFAGSYSNVYKKFENDYWGLSLKELLQKEKIEQLSTDNDELKFTTCGISRGTVKYYLKKNNIKFKIVRDDEKPEFVILTNRTIDTYIYSKNINEKTCFDKHKNENILEVKRNGLTLSAIQSIN